MMYHCESVGRDMSSELLHEHVAEVGRAEEIRWGISYAMAWMRVYSCVILPPWFLIFPLNASLSQSGFRVICRILSVESSGGSSDETKRTYDVGGHFGGWFGDSER